MRKLTRIIIGLGLLGGISQQGSVPLYRLLVLPFALVLYPFAVLLVLTVLISPFVFGLGAWLVWRRYRDGRFPDWARIGTQRLRGFTARHTPTVTRFARRVAARVPRRSPRECAERSMRPCSRADCPKRTADPRTAVVAENARKAAG
jgi:hypothetical protein